MASRGWRAAWLLVLLCAGSAHAAQPKRARVAVFLLPAPGHTPQLVARVSAALQGALAADPRLEVKDSDKLLLEFSGEIPTARIEAARSSLDEGLELLRNGSAAEAVSRLEQAVAAYEETLAHVKKDLLARAAMALGAALASARQPRRAYSTFVELLTWRPRLAYDTSLLDPAHLPLFEKARAAVGKQKRGSVELTTEPPGARAYVDGKFMGVTPTTVFGLRVGPHYATYKQAGFIKAAQRITVSGSEQRRYSLELGRSEKFLLLERSLAGAGRALGQPTASADMLSLQTVLFVDQVIFVAIGPAAGGRIALKAFLYDLRSKLRLNAVTRSIDGRGLQEVAMVARDLYLRVRTDGALDAPPDAPPPPPPRRTRFYTTWWFWSAVAVGGAAVGLSVALWPRSHGCEAAGAGCRWARF